MNTGSSKDVKILCILLVFWPCCVFAAVWAFLYLQQVGATLCCGVWLLIIVSSLVSEHKPESV